MAVDVNGLRKAYVALGYHAPDQTFPNVWTGEAHGVTVTYETEDFEAEYWVSPILNMRQKGVALVDSAGQMVKCERRDR